MLKAWKNHCIYHLGQVPYGKTQTNFFGQHNNRIQSGILLQTSFSFIFISPRFIYQDSLKLSRNAISLFSNPVKPVTSSFHSSMYSFEKCFQRKMWGWGTFGESTAIPRGDESRIAVSEGLAWATAWAPQGPGDGGIRSWTALSGGIGSLCWELEKSLLWGDCLL